MAMRTSGKSLNSGVEVWAGPSAWFWRVINPRYDFGIIGVTASEAEALREAHVALEEMLATAPDQDDRGCQPFYLEPFYF
ncbi:MAG: hypothetical protein ACREQN_06590 [Candidatus Binataceae bacterium]